MDVFPSPQRLQLALLAITERIARQLAEPTSIAPDWPEQQWLLAQAVATIHGVSGLLAHRERWRGPDSWDNFLDSQEHHVAARHGRIQILLADLHEAMRKSSIAGVALKGAALHDLGLYRPGERPMADIDLLVQPKNCSATVGVLNRLGYKQASASWKEIVFTPLNETACTSFGEHSDRDIKIELHSRICERLPWRIRDISGWIFPVSPDAGLNPYPSPAAVLMHLLLHAAGAMAFKWMRLIHLNDIALLCRKMTSTDWQELSKANELSPGLWWAFPALALTSKYFPDTVPHSVLAATGARCSWPLRSSYKSPTITQLSCSYLWVDAFPGIEWSQSFPELIQYVYRRVIPDREYAALRKLAANDQIWAPQSEWSGLSQGARILRWVRSRPIRAPVMYAVTSAMNSLHEG